MRVLKQVFSSIPTPRHWDVLLMHPLITSHRRVLFIEPLPHETLQTDQSPQLLQTSILNWIKLFKKTD